VDASERIVISDLDADTRVVPEGRTPGRYVASIPEWWKAQFAFGGMTSTIALRAAEAAIGRPELVPVSATAIFCSPVPCGDVVVDTDVLRTGKSVVHGQSVVRRLAPIRSVCAC
jgi:acyl-CoA thioesterase